MDFSTLQEPERLAAAWKFYASRGAWIPGTDPGEFREKVLRLRADLEFRAAIGAELAEEERSALAFPPEALEPVRALLEERGPWQPEASNPPRWIPAIPNGARRVSGGWNRKEETHKSAAAF
jgi:hypothetical protein